MASVSAPFHPRIRLYVPIEANQKEFMMKTLVIRRSTIVSILAAMFLIYGVQGISYGQDKAPTVTPGENNTSLIVSFPGVCDESENAYQIQLRRKSPQGEWTTKCVIVRETDSSILFIFIVGGGDCVGDYAIFGGLEPGVTYEARYRDTNQSVCVENPLSPGPWSNIGEGTTHVVAPPRVEFIDANLAGAVRSTLRLSRRGEHIDFLKIPKAKLAQLRELDLYDLRVEEVTNLSGLEHATQLTVLVLYDNKVNDLTPLAQLTQLTELDLSYNEISDVTPLAQLTQLTELDLSDNQISDVTPLAQLANSSLTSLSLSNNNISDVTPLVQLANSSLVRLYLSFNQISDVTPLPQLIQLKTLSLWDNNILDITPLIQLTQLETLSLSDTYPLNVLFDANPEIDIDIEVSKEKGGPTITASTLQPLTGLKLDGARVTLTLSSGEFESSRSKIRNALTISGIPGIDIAEHWGDIEDVSKTEIEIILTFSGDNIESNSVLTLTVEPGAIANYNGPARTLQLPVTATTEIELSEVLVASTSYPLTAVTLNDGRVTLRSTIGAYADEWTTSRNIQVSGVLPTVF